MYCTARSPLSPPVCSASRAAVGLQALLWHHPPVADALVARLSLADLVALGSTARVPYLALLCGPQYLAKRLAAERALSFHTSAALRPWVHAKTNGDHTLAISPSGGVVLRVAPPLSAFTRQPTRWSRTRRRLAEAWARVRLGGWPLHPMVFAEAVLAAATGGDARLIVLCVSLLVEHMRHGGGHACADESAEALAMRVWAERDGDDMERALPVVAHVITVLLMRAHGLDVAVMPEHTVVPRRPAHNVASCHVDAGWPAIEAEAVRRLFGGFVHDAVARQHTATTYEIARRVVGLFLWRVGACRLDAHTAVDPCSSQVSPDARGDLFGLAADCAAALAASSDVDWAWRYTLQQAIERLSDPLARRPEPSVFPST
ncbi:hypothetical protein pkur_cds_743 [Pandoravirus kuranda]|uniref:Uncharacterized protein n=1 Tax=Pandoravirus kuranda TaxID=3019033 RepID=A0AA95EDP7_9VIRU|nr:hypothetical protein pkur_cds_743 [Pandoravirus kuranda]